MMTMITLYVRQQKRHRCIEQSFGLWERVRVGRDRLPEPLQSRVAGQMQLRKEGKEIGAVGNFGVNSTTPRV